MKNDRLIDIFSVFFKIGAFSFGGGYAMVLVIQREVVEKQKWLTNEEFISMLALAQSAPGPMVVNTSIMIGFKLQKTKGALMAALGSILPSFLILLTIALVFSHIADNEIVRRLFMGIRPAVASLILTSAIIFAKKNRWWTYPISIAAAYCIYIGISPLLLILMAAIFGLGYTYYKIRKERVQ